MYGFYRWESLQDIFFFLFFFFFATLGLHCCAQAFSSHGSQALECWLSIDSAPVLLLHGMWDLPGPGMEPDSPALAGRFLTTGPPGRSCRTFLNPQSQFHICRIRIFRNINPRNLHFYQGVKGSWYSYPENLVHPTH